MKPIIIITRERGNSLGRGLIKVRIRLEDKDVKDVERTTAQGSVEQGKAAVSFVARRVTLQEFALRMLTSLGQRQQEEYFPFFQTESPNPLRSTLRMVKKNHSCKGDLAVRTVCLDVNDVINEEFLSDLENVVIVTSYEK